MKKWQYAVYYILFKEDLVIRLDALGYKGWEVIQLSAEHDQWMVLVKRQIEEGKVTLPEQHERS